MKSPGYLTFISACLLIFSGHFISQIQSTVTAQTLNYVESSSGLSNPAWEGGRTELEFADINQDGNIDIITIGDHGSPLINSGEHGIMVYFGDGAGNWNVQMTGDFGYGGIAAGDVNNDGDLDLGSISFGCCAGIHVYLNNSDGTWTQSFGVLGGNSDMIFQFGDIFNDGYIDFIAGHEYATVYMNDGEGNFSPADFDLPSGRIIRPLRGFTGRCQ